MPPSSSNGNTSQSRPVRPLSRASVSGLATRVGAKRTELGCPLIGGSPLSYAIVVLPFSCPGPSRTRNPTNTSRRSFQVAPIGLPGLSWQISRSRR